MKLHRSVVWVFAVALLAGAVAPSFAGDKKDLKGGPGIKPLELLDRAANADTVKLDDDQKAKVHTIIEDATAQAQALKDDAKSKRGTDPKDKTDHKEAHGNLMELVAQTKEHIEALLTDTQKTAFRAAVADERAKAKADRDANGGGAGGDHPKKDKPAT